MLCIRGTSHGPVSVCLSVSVSVTSRCSTASGPGEGDIDATDLEREITSFVGFALEKNLRNLSAIQSLNYIYQHSLIDLYYPNTAIALRLLTTLPVTVASCERSFSKLKLIKTYQRNTMAQEKTSRFIGHFNRTRDLQIGGYLRACWSVRQLEGKEVLFWCAFNISPFHHWSASMLCLLYLYLVILYMVH